MTFFGDNNKWLKYLIIAIIVVVLIAVVIFVIKYFRGKESFEKFESKDLPTTGWSDTKANINDFVNSWKTTIRKAYSKPEQEGYVSSRQLYGSAERKRKQAEAIAAKNKEGYQESRTRKNFESPLSGLSVKTGINYRY